MLIRIEELQVLFAYGEFHLSLFPGFQPDLAETLEFLHRTQDRGLVVTYVELHDLGTGPVARIAQHETHVGDCSGTAAADSKRRIFEAGVTQAVTEWEEHVNALCIEPAVAHEYAFAVETLAIVREVHTFLMGRRISEGQREAERQLAAWVDISEEHVGNGLTGFGAYVPGLDYGRHFLHPRHCDRIAAYQNHGEMAVHLCQGLYELILSVRESELLAVLALAVLMAGLVETAHKDDVVGFGGLGDGIGNQLSGTAALAEVLTGADSVVVATGVTHIAALPFNHGARSLSPCPDSGQRGNLLLDLE